MHVPIRIYPEQLFLSYVAIDSDSTSRHRLVYMPDLLLSRRHLWNTVYTLNGQEMHAFERLEIEGHECFEFAGEFFAAIVKAIINCRTEGVKVFVVLIV